MCSYYPQSKIELLDIVVRLLQEGREGEFWDFKQEWHDNTSDLIKDIVCFSNTVHDKDCYLIFGVDNDQCVVGMQKARKKQADILDTLDKLYFAGDIKPKIRLESINLYECDIDILIIENINNTPIYLNKQYGEMRLGCIYTRNKDKNTQDNGNATIFEIEMLWKKRLGLTKSPLEYIYSHLQNKVEWNEMNGIYYNIYRPEYTIIVSDDEDSYRGADEFYFYAMTNPSGSFMNLDIQCHGTILDGYQLVVLDSGRYKTPIPEWGYINGEDRVTRDKLNYKYVIKNSNSYLLHMFLFDQSNKEQEWARKRFFEVVLLFNDNNEKFHFEQFAKYNMCKLIKYIEEVKDSYSYIVAENERITNLYKQRLQVGLGLNKLLMEFRDIN